MVGHYSEGALKTNATKLEVIVYNEHFKRFLPTIDL